MLKLNIQPLVDKKFQNNSRFAEAMGISYQTISKLYSGEIRNIRLDTIEKLCIVLECTPDKLFISDDPDISSPLQNSNVDHLLEYALRLQKLSKDISLIKQDSDSLLLEINESLKKESDD